MALATRVLTADGADVSGIDIADGVVTLSAPTSNHELSNLRKVFWPATETATTEQQACATWQDQSSGYVQEGIALRVLDQGGRVRALTVTKNVIYGVQWTFNVHTWDTSLAQPFTPIGQYDLSAVVTANGDYLPFPWRVCARASGDQLTFKVWLPDREAEPAWDDAVHARTTTVPSDYLAAGTAGWYIGHVPAGGTAHYADLGVWAGSLPGT